MKLHAVTTVLLLLGAPGCLVTKNEYNKVVADAADAKAQSDTQHKKDAQQIDELREKLDAAEKTAQGLDQKLSDLSTARHNAQAQFDEATAMNQQLRSECDRVGKDVDAIMKEKGTLAKALDDARARLAELRKMQAAAEERAALFKKFEQRFAAMIQANQVAVGTRNGRFLLTVPSDLLFDRGRTDIKATGKGALLEIAKAMSGVPGRKFLVGAHTDAAATGSSRYATNWELSAMRAAQVVKLLVASGVHADALAAAGYADADPVDPSDAAKNRRVEVVLRLEPSEVAATPDSH
jgi:chemotaxis protein MotB